VAGILHCYGEKGPGFLEPEPLPVEEGEAVIVNAPLGVQPGIQPWNYPLYQVARFAGPNLVAGNTVLLKHSKVYPQTALALEQLFADAGAPDGVYTNVFLSIPDVERVIAHPCRVGSLGSGMSPGQDDSGRGRGYCAEDSNVFVGHVDQIASSEGSHTLLLRCPRCDSHTRSLRRDGNNRLLDRQSCAPTWLLSSTDSSWASTPRLSPR
jgi:hypothetical protein